ncbi:MAG: hypothetical protein IJK58_09525, partial [Clostridia bacterium]|nr:hypothetical protein [Clostridia bacterium]
VDTIMEMIVAPIEYLLELLSIPVVGNLTIPDHAFDVLLETCSGLGYVLPIPLILGCLAFSFALYHFQIIWTLFCRLKSFSSSSFWTR